MSAPEVGRAARPRFVAEAFHVLRCYAAPVSAIVLAVWLPGHLLVEYLSYEAHPGDLGPDPVCGLRGEVEGPAAGPAPVPGGPVRGGGLEGHGRGLTS